MLELFMDALTGGSERDRQIDALRALDDHELADLGLVRDQIDAYVDASLETPV